MRKYLLPLGIMLLGVCACGAFQPTDIPGCVLWLKADAIAANDGDLISSWADSSGSNNPATQATSGNQPTLRTNAINGLPAVRFDGNDGVGTAVHFAKPYTILAVGKMQGSQNGRLVSATQASSNWLLGWWGGQMNVLHAGAWVRSGGAPPDTIPHLYMAKNNNSTQWFSGNGTNLANNSNGMSDIGRLTLGVGYDNEFSKGDVAEVVIYNTAISSNDEARVGYYLQSKYGISGSYPAQGPVIETRIPTNTTTSSVFLNGWITDVGAGAPTATVYWGTADGTNNAVAWATNASFAGTQTVGPLSTNITGLTADSLYFYRYFAGNSGGESWAANSETFITAPLTVEASDADAVEWVPGLGGPDTGTYTLTRPEWATGITLAVTYTMDGTAANGVDYHSLNGTVSFPPGSTTLDLTLTPISRAEVTGPMTAVLTLQAGAYPLGAMNSATVTIADAASGPWYVRTDGSDSASGTNWGEAFQTVSNALLYALNGDTIYVSNGTYNVTQPLVLARGVTVLGIGGWSNTTVNGGGVSRVFQLSHSNAVVDGFTITNGFTATGSGGGGAFLAGGTLRNCAVRGNRVALTRDGWGGGVLMSAGVLSNCLVRGNRVLSGTNVCGGGVYAAGGLVVGTTISHNDVSAWDYNVTSGHGGGLVLAGSARARDCVVASNFLYSANWTHVEGAGVFITDSGVLADSWVIGNEARPDAASYGGGIRMTSGTVTNCVIDRNVCFSHYTYGGGVYMTGGRVVKSTISGSYVGAGHVEEAAGIYQTAGTVDVCVVRGNVAGPRGSENWGGGGISQRGGLVQNSLIVGNTANSTHKGGGIYLYAGTLQNCTIVSNTAVADPGGGLRQDAGTVANTIVYHNIGNPDNVSKIGGVFTYSCSTPLVSGGSDANNTASDPTFVDVPNGGLTLLPGSPCIDTGSSAGAPAYDLLGMARPLDGDGDSTAGWDMGCYEFNPSAGPLACNFNADVTLGLDTLDSAIAAELSGGNTNVVYYWWDFGNGTLEGPDLGVVTGHYSAIGQYTVSLTVSNSGGETASATKPLYINIVTDSDAHVSPVGGHAYPFDTWAKASTNVREAVTVCQDVVALGGAHHTVWITNGTYSMGAQQALITVGIEVRSVNGAGVTTVHGNNATRVFNVLPSATNTWIEGLTVSNAYTLDNGAGVNLSRGTIRSCRFVANRGMKGGAVYMGSSDCRVESSQFDGNTSYDQGGALYMLGGVVTNCSLVSNLANSHHGRAGGAVVVGGLMVNCTVLSNRVQVGHTSGAGGLLVSGGTVRQCVLAWNYEVNGDSAGGGGVYQAGGVVESCTIVTNRMAGQGGGLRIDGGTSINNIVYYNGGTNAPWLNLYRSGGVVQFCCSSPLISGGSNTNNIDTDPVLRNYAAGDYTPWSGSPCVDTGASQPWMAGALDLKGRGRVSNRVVDMGAFEAPPRGTVFLSSGRTPTAGRPAVILARLGLRPMVL